MSVIIEEMIADVFVVNEALVSIPNQLGNTLRQVVCCLNTWRRTLFQSPDPNEAPHESLGLS